MTSMSSASLTHGHAEADGDPWPPPAELQLFCLPHAGGNSAHFRAWTWLAPYARVVPTDLPGHGGRLGEPLAQDWEQLAGGLAEAIAAQVDGPYALFGHSLGSLLAFDISHRLLARGMPPALLVAAGRNGPGARPAHPPVHQLPEGQFIAALHRLGGMPDALLRQPELLQMFLPVLRADMRLAERYRRPALAPLPVPVMAFAGTEDPMTDDQGVLAWKQETTSTCELVFLPGGHFFLDRPQFAGALTERIARLAYPVAV
jgi:surfactin synthase thioesterase subunit